ncbi:MAG: hypothetical protein ACLSBF_08970 [Alphaproteobacteria bacterium]
MALLSGNDGQICAKAECTRQNGVFLCIGFFGARCLPDTAAFVEDM